MWLVEGGSRGHEMGQKAGVTFTKWDRNLTCLRNKPERTLTKLNA